MLVTETADQALKNYTQLFQVLPLRIWIRSTGPLKTLHSYCKIKVQPPILIWIIMNNQQIKITCLKEQDIELASKDMRISMTNQEKEI